jgi:hypothetical protein
VVVFGEEHARAVHTADATAGNINERSTHAEKRQRTLNDCVIDTPC